MNGCGSSRVSWRFSELIWWHPLQVEGFHRHLETDLGALSALRRSLRSWLQQEGMVEPPLEAVLLATHEAVANSIQHAGAADGVQVRASRFAGEVVVEVSDHGHWKPPTDPDNDERGRGIPLMRALVSKVDITSSARGTRVRLREPVTA